MLCQAGRLCGEACVIPSEVAIGLHDCGTAMMVGASRRRVFSWKCSLSIEHADSPRSQATAAPLSLSHSSVRGWFFLLVGFFVWCCRKGSSWVGPALNTFSSMHGQSPEKAFRTVLLSPRQGLPRTCFSSTLPRIHGQITFPSADSAFSGPSAARIEIPRARC